MRKILNIKSSNIHNVAYLENENILFIEFKSGPNYKYHNVSIEVANFFFSEIESGKSAGKLFNNFISNKYHCEKISPIDWEIK